MTHLVRFRRGGTIGVGVLDGTTVRVLPGVSGVSELLRQPLPEIRSTLDGRDGDTAELSDVELLAPVDGHTEVWAAGVTYERSRDARLEESGGRTVYDDVYTADRPELFFKAVPWRVVSDGEPAGIRSDAENSVPEPEFAVMANCYGEIVGAGVCDDLTSRSIEAANPLYLPQAKTYAGSCALAARIRPWWELADPYDLAITMTVRRGDETVFSGDTSTAQLSRRADDLLARLFAHDRFPDGVVLSTGTGIVPPLDFTLRDGDEVTIDIAEVGRLHHRIAQGPTAFAHRRP